MMTRILFMKRMSPSMIIQRKILQIS